MSLILQIETATTACSVALSVDGKTIAVREENQPNIHASHVTLFIMDVLAMAGRNIRQVEAVAVSRGPGSYTGLRIGVSTAKGLCFGLDIPLLAIDTLTAMTAGILARESFDNTFFCPMIDARRMEVYTSIFNSSLESVRPVDALIVDEHAFDDILPTKKMLFFGDGAAKCKSVIDHPNALFLDDFSNSSSDMSALAFDKLRRNEFEDLAYFEPYYLKEFLFKEKAK